MKTILLIALLLARPGPSGSLYLDQCDPVLGDVVTFTWQVSNLPGWAEPRIQVVCYQGTTLVFGTAAPANDPVLLGGAASDWRTNGGPAECIATLYYWRFHPRQEFNLLANNSFSARG